VVFNNSDANSVSVIGVVVSDGSGMQSHAMYLIAVVAVAIVG
jgi:hypothetical protein